MPEHQQIQQSKKTNTIFQKQLTPISQTPISNPYTIIQRARINPKSLTHADIMQLQRTIGNRAVGRLLSGIGNSSTTQQAIVQRQETPEEEEALQGKMTEAIQRQEIPEEEEPLQGKMIGTIQRQEIPEIEEEETLQGKMAEAIQRQEIPEEPLQTKKENNTGMPDNLKAGVENLSGIDMSDVRVHYNSDKPAGVGALAYTQGTNIHVATGQEMHLPHEAWHVVQQKQGRVQPTMLLKDVAINDSEMLEHEADVMGEKGNAGFQVIQRVLDRSTVPPLINQGQQDKHIATSDTYYNQTKRGDYKNYLIVDAQDLLTRFIAGEFIIVEENPAKRMVTIDFGFVIGCQVDRDTGKKLAETRYGKLVYGNTPHIFPFMY